MPETTSLSLYLLECVKSLHESDTEDLSHDECQELRNAVDLVAGALVESRVGLTDQIAARSIETAWGINREVMGGLFDEYYTTRLLKDVRKFVRRTTKLGSLIVTNLPSEEVRVYAREACRNYVFGFWRSCIILSRAALETGLRECLKQEGASRKELSELIRKATELKLLDGAHEDFAREIQRYGNYVVHANSSTAEPKERASFDTLTKLRSVLRHLYGDAQPSES